MRKLLAIILLILMGIGFYMFIDKNITPSNQLNNKNIDILEYDLENNYPSTPREVIILYNKLQKKLYQNKKDDEKIQQLIKQQRKLFHKELLDKNPYDIQIDRLKIELEKTQDNKIIESKIQDLTPDNYFGERKELCKIKTIYYLINGNIYIEFLLQKDEQNSWKILGWQNTDEFTIMED